MALIMVLLLLDLIMFAKPMLLYVLHLEDSQEDTLLTSSQCCQHAESVYVQKSRYKNIEMPNIIYWCGARQLALFFTIERYKNMLAAGKKRSK